MKKYCNRRSSEDGVALVFALSMLALLLIMLIGFLASSILEQRIAYSYRDDVGSRLLVRSAMVRVLAQLRNETDDLLFIRNGSTAENIMTPLVSMSNVGTPTTSNSEPAATTLDGNGNPRYAYRALKPLLKKYFGPDTTTGNVENDWEWRNWFPQSGAGAPAMYYPEWIYYYQSTLNGSGSDRLTGRMAYVVVPNLGINLSQFGSGNTRKGVQFDELPQSTFLTSAGVTRLNRLDNWLSPDILLGKPGLYSNSSTANNVTKSVNEYFNFAQLDIAGDGNTPANFFSGELGGSMNSTTTPGDYREFATLFLTGDDQKVDATAYNEANRSKTGTALQLLPTGTNHATWETFVTDNFDITGTQAKQVAANIKDYIDGDDVPTSDVADTKTWLTETPNFTGNEKTPYINQIVPAVQLTGNCTISTNSDGLSRFDAFIYHNVEWKMDFSKAKGKVFIELINIYPESLSNVNKIVLKDVKFDLAGTVRFGRKSTVGEFSSFTPDTDPGSSKTVNESFSKDVELSGVTVSPNGYALVSTDFDFSGSIASVSGVKNKMVKNIGNLSALAVDVTLKISNFGFERAVLLDKDGNGIDFVKGMSIDEKKDFIGIIESENILEPADSSYAWTFSKTGSETSSAYANFEVKDPRCNLNPSNWMEPALEKEKAEITTLSTLKLGSINNNLDDDENTMKNNKLPEAGKDDEWKDLEPEEDPAKVSSGYIRNGAMESIFELGLIHRGKPWQTFNLRSTVTDPDLTTKLTSNVVNGVSKKKKLTYMNDAAILERYRLGTNAKAPKFNINQPANMTGAFAPLVEGLQYNTLPGQTAQTLDENAKRDLRLWLANKCYDAGGNNPTATTAKCYNRYTRHSEVVNVITNWALKSDYSPIKSDTAIEELVAKIVPLVRFGEMYEYYTVFAVAQTIKDLDGSISRYDNNGNLTQTLAHAGRWDNGLDMITSETWLVARIRRTIDCQPPSGSTQIPISCLWGQHSTNCTKNVTVLECYTMNPE